MLKDNWTMTILKILLWNSPPSRQIRDMKLKTVLSKANSVLSNTFNYLRTRRERRLYQQWIEQADLPPEAIPREEATREAAPRIGQKRLRMYILFTLLGAALAMACGGLILLVARSC